MSVADLPDLSSITRSMAPLFPLPLTAIEAFMVADGRAGYSMLVDVELDFLGRLNRATFERALAWALARNPLFSCRVERVKNEPCWVLADEPPRVAWVSRDAPLGDDYGGVVDWSRENGTRIWVRQGENETKVLFHFHHACCDAIGTFGFLGDLLAAYATLSPGSKEVRMRRLDPRGLLVRGQAGLTGRSGWRKLYDALCGAREGVRFFVQAPRTLATGAKSAADGAPLAPNFITANCPADVTAGVRRAGQKAGGTANDVLLRDLFIVLRQWNTEHGDPPGRRRLRILMPQNLREKSDYATPAANVMSFAFMTRSAALCDKPDELLKSISEETAAVKRGKLSIYFTAGLETLRGKKLLETVLRRPWCFSTAVLTNVGDPTRRFGATFPRCEQGLVVGDVVLRQTTTLPPLRPLTRAAFSVTNCGATLSLGLKLDSSLYSAADAHDLLGRYLAQLRATAERG